MLWRTAHKERSDGCNTDNTDFSVIHGKHNCFESDLWLIAHRNSLWIRKTNITQSSAPDDGHMVARNMLSNY